MPPRLLSALRRMSLVFVVLAVAGSVRGGPDAAATVPVEVPPQAFPKVHIDGANGGGDAEGVLRLAAVPLRVDTGTRVIDIAHVRRVTFPLDHTAEGQDTVELSSKDIVRGRVTADEFAVETGSGVKTFKRAEVREIRVLHEEKLSPLGILIGLLTLTIMEIILGVDNVIFLAIVTSKLPPDRQPQARRIGLGAALGTRILLLLTLSFLLGLTTPLFTLPDFPLLHDLEAREVSARDLILLVGGAFLIGKSVLEMHEKLEHARAEQSGTPPAPGRHAGFARTIVTIAVIDIVFSLDSVITAIGMVEDVRVMIAAMVVAMLVMLWFSGPIGRFVDHHPTIKVLALAFLILIGVMLVAEGLGQHMNKGYIYFAMAFAVVIELVNLRLRGPSSGGPATSA